MDKVIRVIQGANGVLTCGQKVLSKLDFRPNNSVGREKEKEKEKRGEILEREPPLLSRFLGDRTDGSWRSKKKSASPRKEFQVETRNGEFLWVSGPNIGSFTHQVQAQAQKNLYP